MATPKISAVIYNGVGLIPAPLISINRNTHRTEDGHGVGHTMTATLTGKLVSWKGWATYGCANGAATLYGGAGYPADDTAVDSKFGNLLAMQDAFRKIFRVDNEYHWFEIQALDCDCPPHRWLARIQDVNFKEGLWVETAEYSITLELLNSADEFGSDAAAMLMSNTAHSERWDIQFSEENAGAYKLTHTITASAKQYASSDNTTSLLEDWADDESGNTSAITDGWAVAKQWVDARLTDLISCPNNVPPQIDTLIFNGSVVLNGTLPYNYERSVNIDQLAGTYTVTETWMMSKYPVIRNVNLEYDKPRDADYIIKVNGTFKGMGSGADAMTAFKDWEADGSHGPFAMAQAAYTGARTLNSCPVNRVVINHTQAGLAADNDTTGTPYQYLDMLRTVEFTLEYSDGGASLCDADITITEKVSYVAVENECAHTLTVEGILQGHKCADNNVSEPLINATNYFNSLNLLSMAMTSYTGSNAAVVALISSSLAKDDRKGTIHFNYEYSDLYGITGLPGVKKEETQTTSFTCETRGSDGNPLQMTTVEGVLTGLCSVSWATMLSDVPASTSFTNITCPILTRQSISYDQIHLKITYSYTFESECGLAIRHIDTTTKVGPDKCAITYYNVVAQFDGVGCNNTLASSNAQADFATFNPLSVLPVTTVCQLAKTVVLNNYGKLTATYEFADYTHAPFTTGNGTVETMITVTESLDSSECGILKTNVNGHIKGCCGASQGAYQAALDAYNGLDLQSFCTGFITAKSKTEDQLNGTISFTLECQERPHQYIEEKNITTKCDVFTYYTTVSIEGSITPLCNVLDPNVSADEGDVTEGQAAQVSAGEAAWETVKATLPGLAASACGSPADSTAVCTVGTPVLRRSQVSISQINGKVNYTHEYMCAPCQRVPGTVEESLEFQCNIGGQMVAIIPILGRTCGPVLQDKGTRKESTYTINIMFRFKADCCNITIPAGISDAVNAIIQQAQGGCGCPNGCQVVNTYQIENVVNWKPCQGEYTQRITNLIECC